MVIMIMVIQIVITLGVLEKLKMIMIMACTIIYVRMTIKMINTSNQRLLNWTGDTQIEKERQLAHGREGGGKGVGEEPNHTTVRKPGPL